MTPADVLGLIKEKEVKFVDFRFTDTKGKEQHVTVPAHQVDEDLFEDGKMFDGSSISGWKGINESDMILMPDPASAVVDIFSEDTTLNLRCNVVEPATMQGYDHCPRSLDQRAAGRGRGDRLGLAIEELDPELILGPRDLRAERRLRDPDRGRGPAEMTSLVDGEDVLELGDRWPATHSE